MNVIVKSQAFRQGGLLCSHRFNPHSVAPILFFASSLIDEDIRSAMGDTTARGKRWIYTPLVSITVFLTQCMSADHWFREAVSRLLAGRAKRGLESCSTDTDTYCAARDKLPEVACHPPFSHWRRHFFRSTPSHQGPKSRSFRTKHPTTIFR